MHMAIEMSCCAEATTVQFVGHMGPEVHRRRRMPRQASIRYIEMILVILSSAGSCARSWQEQSWKQSCWVCTVLRACTSRATLA